MLRNVNIVYVLVGLPFLVGIPLLAAVSHDPIASGWVTGMALVIGGFCWFICWALDTRRVPEANSVRVWPVESAFEGFMGGVIALLIIII